MCGRFTLRTPAAQLVAHFELGDVSDRQLTLFESRYNIAPTQEIVVVRQLPDHSARSFSAVRWGLIPSWSKDPSKGPPLINARGETVAVKPSFRSAFRRRRCLIPADGFYEWQKNASNAKGKKRPYYIHRADGGPFAFAGLWEVFPGGASGGPRIESCTIVTTDANETMRPIHERMPVILDQAEYDEWLDPQQQDPDDLQQCIRSAPADLLLAEPVSTYVNSVRHDDQRCIEVQATLFDT